MSASNFEADPLFGFLSVADLGGAVLIGGYLVLNALGRPLEFHCTEPVKPNRAQQILFGETLQPYLYGEQIGQALVNHSELQVHVLFTDQSSMLCLRDFIETPIAWLSSASEPPAAYERLVLGTNSICVAERYADDRAQIRKLYDRVRPEWNLGEPFQRIYEAVAELQKAA